MGRYREHAGEIWCLYLRNIKAVGEWDGKNPFQKTRQEDAANPLIAVITRATIKKKYLRRFWKYVPTSQKPLENNSGLLFTKGIGEVPLVQMATFSIWKDKKALWNSPIRARTIRTP